MSDRIQQLQGSAELIASDISKILAAIDNPMIHDEEKLRIVYFNLGTLQVRTPEFESEFNRLIETGKRNGKKQRKRKGAKITTRSNGAHN